MTNEQVENVMAIAFELARIREQHAQGAGVIPADGEVRS